MTPVLGIILLPVIGAIEADGLPDCPHGIRGYSEQGEIKGVSEINWVRAIDIWLDQYQWL